MSAATKVLKKAQLSLINQAIKNLPHRITFKPSIHAGTMRLQAAIKGVYKSDSSAASLKSDLLTIREDVSAGWYLTDQPV